MRKIIFIDHIYHTKTKSSNFFLDMLVGRFDVHVISVDPDDFDLQTIDAEVRRIAEEDSIVYVWQLDFMAPLFLSMGLPVFCSPMFDGSGGMPPEHWALLRDVRFINFSVDLHEKARAGGAKSLYVKYYPEARSPVAFGKGLRGFFWRRRPEHGLDVKVIDRIFGSQLSSLHIHDAPDTAAGKAISFDATGLRYPVTRSTWFDKAADMRAVMDSCNFYIAPRLSEGIGMGFLEAMSAGMLVAAHDSPTHNEYIVSGLNGVLFNMNSQDVGYLHEPGQIALRAHASVAMGRKNWLMQQQDLYEFLDAPHPVPKVSFTPETALALINGYRKGLQSYLKVLGSLQGADGGATAEAAVPRVLLGRGFHLVENAAERFFPVRVVWTSGPSFTVVPLDDREDLQLVFRQSSGRRLTNEDAARFSVWRGTTEIPVVFEQLETSPFLRLTIVKENLIAFESLEFRADWPLFEVGPGAPGKRRKQGLLLCEAGIELVQM